MSEVKVEEKVRVVLEGNQYTAVLWVGDRYVSGCGKSEEEAHQRLCMTIYELSGQGCHIDPLNLPVAVRKAVLEYGGKVADLARSELIKKTAAYLPFLPGVGYQPEADDPTTYVLSPLEVAANCIHRGAELTDTDPALIPNVLTWFYSEITALELSEEAAKRNGYTQAAECDQAKAAALKQKLSDCGFDWIAATSNRGG